MAKTSTTSTAKNVEKALKSLGTKERATSSLWFFKTGEGQYGFGDKFIGVSVPNQRLVAKKYTDLSLEENKKLLESPLHECRLTALFILVSQYKKGDDAMRNRVAKFYLKNLSRVNNWDLVDSSASQILGQYLIQKDRAILYKLAKSKTLWERRVSIISTFAFIDKSDFNDTLAICELLLNDNEDLIHKAVGWTLREVGKKSKPTLVKFLEQHAHEMPRTALRYSIEHFDKAERAIYMKKRA